ncbi:MAG TPA: hypothetical protein VJM34_16475 [Novosphingobium sp.]|nr:hypothetical protein [Novosphingobium sp.]
MELTPEAEERVRSAIDGASVDLSFLHHRRKAETKGVAKFVAAWEALEPEAKWWIQCELSNQHNKEEPAAFDPSLAAQALLSESLGKQGERPEVWPVKAAVRELFAIFVEDNGPAEVGNRAHRESEGKAPHPACRFVGFHLVRLFPDVFGQDRATAERRADSYLRELNARNELPTRKKRAK